MKILGAAAATSAVTATQAIAARFLRARAAKRLSSAVNTPAPSRGAISAIRIATPTSANSMMSS